MTDDGDEPVKSGDDVFEAWTSRESAKLGDLRQATLQSAVDATQERPSFVVPDPFPPASEKLDAFTAATIDRMSAAQTHFLERFETLLASDESADEDTAIEQTRLVRQLARDLRILIAVVVALLAVSLWTAGR